ncbi:MAG: quinolinate synthase [Candidatus Omnitrophica bacterium CG1_02_49_10]|nr:MAG: quinolinate synthase [Candidatus Omnitrophica bacterium CG1_02_49_10]
MKKVKEDDKSYIDKLKKRVSHLKKEKNAAIIVHNYQREEIQDVADFTGDSLALSEAAINIKQDIIVFCGVHFMAETAALLNPAKKVLLPVKEAGCPMADMVTVEKLRAKKREYPDAAVVCYVNSSVRIKAESDICCTSSNAVEIVDSIKDRKRVIFVPDKNLGRYVQSNLPNKEIVLWEGFCPTHIRVSDEEVMDAKSRFPDAEFIAHPECQPDVLALADHICSTGGMFKYVKASKCKSFIVGTESGLLYRLRLENPDKQFILPTEHLVCPSMKMTTLGWVVHALEAEVNRVDVASDIAVKAKRALEKMLEVSGGKKWQAVSGY